MGEGSEKFNAGASANKNTSFSQASTTRWERLQVQDLVAVRALPSELIRNVVDKVREEERMSDSDMGTLEWTEEEETKLRHKMDRRTVPWVTVLYLLCVCTHSPDKATSRTGQRWHANSQLTSKSPQFLDRVNIGNARIQGLEADLKLVGLQFNWTLSIFYIVYLLVEVPSNILLKHFGPR